MPRKPIEDIVPNGRSIRNIPVPEGRARTPRPTRAKTAPVEPRVEPKVQSDLDLGSVRYIRDDEPVAPTPIPDQDTIRSVRQEFASRNDQYVQEYSNNGSRRKKTLVISVISIIAIALIVMISNVFHAATITVTPRIAQMVLDENITAQKSAVAAASTTASTGSSLVFNTITLSEIGSAKVAAAGEEKVNRAASGTIIIYNNYNATAQRLVKNTRFETPEGLIYRITDSVTVPGKKGTTPGSVEALVVADATGEKYNVGLKDFTIPGFKGDPRFNTFYARSKTPLDGGFVGTVKVVVDADRLKAQTDIKTRATVNLLQKLAVEKTPEQVFFDNAYTVDCTPLPQETLSDKEVLIKMECSLSAAVFDIKSLSAHLAATKRVAGFNSADSVAIDNLSDLTFKPKTPFTPGSSDSVAFSLAGDAKLVWLYDVDSLKGSFVDKTKSDAQSIIQGFPMIQKVDVSIRPPWRRSFPADAKDITVLTDLAI